MEFSLPHPDVLWARVRDMDGTYVNFDGRSHLASTVDGFTDVCKPEGSRLVAEDGAGNWFALVHLDRGRAVLFGCDESTDLHDTEYDPWASAPEWVAAIDRGVDHPRVFSEFVTFARWWDGQRWLGTPFAPEVVGELADSPDVSDGLYMGLRGVAGEWFPGNGPATDRVSALAAVSDYRSPEPGMRYRRTTIEDAKSTEATGIFVEFDARGIERRRVEHFRDGSMGFAGVGFSTGTTRMSRDPVEPVERTTRRPGVTAVDISAEEFQVEWVIAVGEDLG
ncbi:hypothetical protein FOH10_28860 [Nocardia otitidiscaviarum]|uniref:DUF6881 domain-containing protein n=1 Tax=Nocardia otitidiscaviarum TaxID=1823 RepID=A0A516NTB3_9NOCA|nr:hypothetical protein [Nocardia otitidiscaviarum]MCP9621455.1 hypothetical protein [Nocardia otitidiscaviarum]QDP82142.1 hypothetical protein FOH10_28860 [Nocardia otitidiscaviarum]